MGSNKKAGQSLYVTLHQISFLATGLCTTLGVQWLFYKGAASSMSLLPQLSSYSGMILVGLFIPLILRRKNRVPEYKGLFVEEGDHSIQISPLSKEQEKAAEEDAFIMSQKPHINISPLMKKEEGPIPHFSIMKLASLDLMANFSVTIGFSIIGSGMYQVIYSSVVVWCAILSWLIMGRVLSKTQWLSILGATVGLGISSLDSLTGTTFQTDNVVIDEVGHVSSPNNTLLGGTLITLGGTFLYACIYVYADHILSPKGQHQQPPLPARVCFWMGIYTSIFTWIWIAVYTIPQFGDLIHVKEGTTTSSIVFTYLIITAANSLHSWNYYELIDRIGNVATGILQGLRAILVYGISHQWFCQQDSAQCFTTSKGLGSLVVIGCVLLFTIGKAKN